MFFFNKQLQTCYGDKVINSNSLIDSKRTKLAITAKAIVNHRILELVWIFSCNCTSNNLMHNVHPGFKIKRVSQK